MRFFNRKDEMALLRRIREESKSSARMTILKGRRRIGKTALLQEAYGDEDFLYFFVARDYNDPIETDSAHCANDRDCEVHGNAIRMCQMSWAT